MGPNTGEKWERGKFWQLCTNIRPIAEEEVVPIAMAMHKQMRYLIQRRCHFAPIAEGKNMPKALVYART